LSSKLIDAAMKRGDFAGLSPKDQLTAVVRAIEFAHGRPTAAEKKVERASPPTVEDSFA
jgi:hypothetical protein